MKKKHLKSQPDATFDKEPPKRNVNSLVSRSKEINSQRFSAGAVKSGGGGQGPAMD